MTGRHGIRGFHVPQAARLTKKQYTQLFMRHEAGLFAAEKLASDKKLDSDAKSDLQWIRNDGLRAKAHLIEAFVYLVHEIAVSSVRVSRAPDDELIWFGTVALIEAIDKYDFAGDVSLIPHLRQAVRSAIEFHAAQ
jgi:RNA polymerase primary sigma factor